MPKRFTCLLVLALLLSTACENFQNADGGGEAGASGLRTGASAGAGGNSSDSSAPAAPDCPADTAPFVATRARTVARPGDSTTQIVVNADRPLGPISELIYGANHRYPYNGFNMWDSRKGEPYPLFVRRFDYAGLSAVRYPGGRTANNFHWRRAIGPVEERLGHVDSAFGRQTIHSEPLSSEFGPDEFGRFLEATGAEGNVVVNFPTGTALEAANWVEYMNAPAGTNPNGGVAWAQERADYGHPEPYGVKYWEVGNELGGEKTFWLGPEATDEERASSYIFGGKTRFVKQPVVTFTDYSSTGSLSTGKPSQIFYVRFPPALAGSTTIYVGGEPWKRVRDLNSAGREKVYSVEAAGGKIRFGDGAHGLIPPKGAHITITYVSGPHDGFNDFYKRMKTVDPSIEIGSGLNSPFFISMMGQTHPYDFLVAHSYSFFTSTPPNTDGLHDLMMGLTEEQASKVEQTKSVISDYAGERRADDIDIVVSEWAMATGLNIGLGRIDAPLHYTQSLDGALYAALMLRQWITLDIPLAEKHALIDINPGSPPPGYDKPRTAYQAVIGPAPCYVLSAPALAFRMYSTLLGPEEVTTSVIGNPSRQTFLGESLDALATVAATDDAGDLSLLVINRDRASDVTAAIRTEGFDEAEAATAWTLNGPGYLAYNSVHSPNKVAIEKTALTGVREGFPYNFPAHSITVVKLRRDTGQ
ncbi:MAG: hypothetical protein M3360_03430 [Actinomycetota bacterium]|nr:hypothetical protein [Actinomycetota bacterium]